MEKSIIGVEIKSLRTHKDDRGFFREIVRVSDPFFAGSENFGQWSHSKMAHNVVKAWHYHHVQTDWWYIALGLCETVLIDDREESPTYGKKMIFHMGDSDHHPEAAVCVKIPPGVLHGCKVLSAEAHLFYITSHTYNPNEEGRYPYNAGPVEHDWGKDALVVDNDKRRFIPTSLRALI